MRILLLTNSAAGNGAKASLVGEVAERLCERGASVRRVSVLELGADPQAFTGALRAALDHADALLVAGGDGTVHHALPALLATGVPVLHMPMGTENLFAREFRTWGQLPGELVERLLAHRVRSVDTLEALAHDAPLCHVSVMASLGPDAGVIRRMDETRTGPITHISYMRPILRELRAPHLPKLFVEVDGRELVAGRTGVLVIANSRQYALRADPARDARVDDGLLDVAFLPARTAIGAGVGLLRACLRLPDGALRATGLSVRVRPEGERVALQADGEHIPLPSPAPTLLTIRLRPGALRVIA